jgi:hypothetical protein
MFKKIVIISFIDLVLIGLYVYYIKPNVSKGLYVFILIPLIFIINIIIGRVFKKSNNTWSNIFFINSFISPLLFFFLFTGYINKYPNILYSSPYFLKGKQAYKISFDKACAPGMHSKMFNISALDNEDSTGVVVTGKYKELKDTLLLISQKNDTLKIINNTLYDFYGKGNKFELHIKDYSNLNKNKSFNISKKPPYKDSFSSLIQQ